LNQLVIEAVYFSPTGGTKTVIESIVAGLNEAKCSTIDLSNVNERDTFFSSFEQSAEDKDVFVIGMPVYFGKIPRFLMKEFEKIDGKGKRAIAVVIYGNRGFDIALNQLVSLLNERHFTVIGAGAFIGEHALSSIFPIAVNRPDERDRSLASEFGKRIAEAGDRLQPITADDVPSKIDTLLRITPDAPPKPKVDLSKCIDCGICVQSCPMGILSPETKRYRDKAAEKLCLGCMRCVKVCPQGARTVHFSALLKFLTDKLFLHDAITNRKEPYTLLKIS